jgi:hypothetical protein
MLSKLPFLLALPLLVATQSPNTVNLTETFRPALSDGAEIYSVNDPNWATETTQRWSNWDAPTYIGAIKPATEQDVAATVLLLLRDLPFRLC